MQLVRVAVPNEHRADVYVALDELDVDYFVTPGTNQFESKSVIEIPVSDGAVGDVTGVLSEAGVELDRYAVVHDLEWAATPNAETIRKRYADRYDRPSHRGLRGLVDKLHWDVRSFSIMLALSGSIAAIGILLDSAVIVVGSAVIAPLINPMLISSIGTIIGEPWMIRDSLRLQVLGLVVAVGSAFTVGLGAEALALAPATLDLPALDLVETRLAPNALAVLVGVVAGAATAVSLTAESSLLNIVGVMVAAALIPAAAAAGVALAWGYPLVALGSALLLVTTVVATDLAILAVFFVLGYRPSEKLLTVPSPRAAWHGAAVIVVLGVLLFGTGAATAGQVVFEQDVNRAVDNVVSDPKHEELSTVAVRSEYADYSPFTGPETVIVGVSRPDGEAYPELADWIADEITAETGKEVTVRIEFVDRQQSS